MKNIVIASLAAVLASGAAFAAEPAKVETNTTVTKEVAPATESTTEIKKEEVKKDGKVVKKSEKKEEKTVPAAH